jgi:hypothetical protein
MHKYLTLTQVSICSEEVKYMKHKYLRQKYFDKSELYDIDMHNR